MGKTLSIYLTDKELLELDKIQSYYQHMLPEVSKSNIIGACIHWFYEETNLRKHKN